MTLQFLRREPVWQAFRDLQKTEFLPLEKLLHLQSQRQLTQLRFAIEQVPYYQESYAPYKDQIYASKDWGDANRLMESLPILEKDTVLEKTELLTAKNIKKIRTYPDKTSGSSGTPIIFPCDQTAWAYRHALVFRCQKSFGVNIGEPYAYIFGLHWNNRTRRQLHLRDWIFNRVRLSAFDISPQKFDEHILSLVKHRPTHFLGYPSAIYDLCVLASERGDDRLLKLKLKGIFTTAEPLRNYQRELITKVTGSRCVDMYGSAEGGANVLECPEGSFHIQTEATWVNLRDPNATSGEIIVTDMMLRAFPMIRYAVGDNVKIKTGTCSCGRSHPMIESIEGRAGYPIILPNGKKINANLPSYIFKPLSNLGVIRRYRFVHTKNDLLELYLVITSRFTDYHLEVIKKEIKQAFGENIVVSISILEKLPDLPNAKHKDYVKL